MRLPAPFVGLTIAIIAEVAVLGPVIVTQREKDIRQQSVSLGSQMDHFVTSLNKTINEFIYSVLQTSGAAGIVPSFFTQRDMENSLVLPKNPSNTPVLLYVWVPLVENQDRAAFESFYGHPMLELNGTTVVNAAQRPIYAPFCLFVPKLDATSAVGFDLLSAPVTSALLRNQSLYLYPSHGILSYLLSTPLTKWDLKQKSFESSNSKSFGLLVVSLDRQKKGYVIGRVGVEDVLAFSLQIPRSEVTFCAFDTSVSSKQQLLFCDNVPMLQHVDSIASFDAIPSRAEFFVRNLNVLGDNLSICVRYSDSYSSTYMSSTWVILVAVLLPVCCCVNMVIFGFWMIWQKRALLLKLEREKREASQIMLSYVNHEIRNPLQAILGLSEVCLEELATNDANERIISNLETVMRSSEFIRHIANDILDIRRIEEGKVALEIAEVDIRLLISGVEKSVQTLLKEKPDVSFRVDVELERAFLESDRYRLEQILMNFLTNAFKHTEHGTVTLKGEFVPTLRKVRLSVADTGRGIAEDKKGKLFAQFSQVDVNDAKSLEGFGLGLYLSKMLATLLGGTIGCESQIGEGSIFWLDLPLTLGQMTMDVQFEESATVVQKKVVKFM